MSPLPFYLVPLTHPTWDEALACVRTLPEDTLPELRLDLWPGLDPATAVAALHRRCLVSCRRASEGGRWPEDQESERLAHLKAAAQERPHWIDLEWDLAVPAWLQEQRTHIRLLRSVHVAPGVFDLEQRLKTLPDGEAYKWVGHAQRLADNARLKAPLAFARDHGLPLMAFLMGPKGIPSRCLQRAWGGCFTFAAPDDAGPSAPGQIPLATLRAWRCHKLTPSFQLCGVLGSPVLHSKGPAFHNPRFQAAFKDLLYLPLETGDAEEALEALEALGILGASLTMPLKETLPARLGLQGPLNTLWRQAPDKPWQGANTDAEALDLSLTPLQPGPVLILGDGGVAEASRKVVEAKGWPCLLASRKRPALPEAIRAFGPTGIIQATSLGMNPEDPLPFPDLMEAAAPTLRWGVEWIYKHDTAFAQWIRSRPLPLIEGAPLFDLQAQGQSRRFTTECS